MQRSWDLFEVAEPDARPRAEGLYDPSEEAIVFRGLPFLALRKGQSVLPPPENPKRIWRNYPESRLVLLFGLDQARGANAHVYRLSLGVMPWANDSSDALNVALAYIMSKNRIVVVAAGNWGPRPGTLSSLATVPGIISVGAAQPDGDVLRLSSRGAPGGQYPTVVADGTAGEDLDLPEGTSHATARVAVWCLWLRSMLQFLTDELHAYYSEGKAITATPIPGVLAHLDTGFTEAEVQAIVQHRMGKVWSSPKSEAYLGGNRRNWLMLVTSALDNMEIRVDVSYSQANVRQLLMNTADSKVCSDPAACGAGFVSRLGIRAYLEGMTPSRFTENFGARPIDGTEASLLRKLDEMLGPLWSKPGLELLEKKFASEFDEVAVPIGAVGATGHGPKMMRLSVSPNPFTKEPVYAFIDEYGNLTIDE